MPHGALEHPLFSLALTVAVFVAASWANQRMRGHPLVNPVLLSVCFLMIFLSMTSTPYARYFEGAQFIHFLLGPATVALAVPMFRHVDRIRAAALPILIGIVSGSVAGLVLVLTLAQLFAAEASLMASLATKSVTAPVAMAIADHTGAIPSLAAIVAVLAGMTGAALGPALLNWLGITDAMARGLAMGTASHGQGTARALQESEEAGAISAIAMGITALIMAGAMPLIAKVAFLAG
jgi:predicted murein hydrolase (TIGR00659 family)